jgi:hypothetical protein
MSNGETRPKPENLGEGPERRMENLPASRRVPHEQEGDNLTQQPGVPKPDETDAVGEGDVEELAQEEEGAVVEEKEKLTQKDNARTTYREPPSDLRRRLRETQPPPEKPPPEGLEEPDV